jgi:hypothetical protein
MPSAAASLAGSLRALMAGTPSHALDGSTSLTIEALTVSED